MTFYKGYADQEHRRLYMQEWRKNRRAIIREQFREWTKNHPDYFRENYRKNRIKINDIINQHSKKFPERVRAQQMMRYHLQKGHIKKTNCVVCNKIKVEGHHPDYSKPLEVIWLCRSHHFFVHRLGKTIQELKS